MSEMANRGIGRNPTPLPDLGTQLLNLPFAYAGTAILLAVAAFAFPQLLTPMFLLLIARQAVPLGVAVLGQSLCLRVLSLDLSIGGIIVGTSYIATSGVTGLDGPALVAACLSFGIAIGGINALFITRLRASSVIVTLAMGMVMTGVVIAASQYRPLGDAPEILRYLGQARLAGIPVAVIAWILLAAPVALFMRLSVFGRYVDAIGANPKAAMVSAIPYVAAVTRVHLLSGFFAACSGLLLVGFAGVGSVDIGADIAISSLAAVILGGVTFGSGAGGILGPAVAAFMLTFSFNLLTSLGLGEPAKMMMQGAIIALAAIAYASRTPKTR
jgi:ribose transport system permease protein